MPRQALVVETEVAKAEEAFPCAQGCGPGKRPSHIEGLVARRYLGLYARAQELSSRSCAAARCAGPGRLRPTLPLGCAVPGQSEGAHIRNHARP